MMTSMERVATVLQGGQPDRVPFFLPVNLHGAPMHGLSIQEYFSKPDRIVEAQLAFQRRLGHDCLGGFTYAAREAEAFGQSTIFYDDGPPNAGPPCIRSFSDIDRLMPPRVEDCPGLQINLAVQRSLKAAVGDAIPVMGLAVSPFSLPVMQMGFDNYLQLMLGDLPRFKRLMEINSEFCAAWISAQQQAGASGVVFYDPVGSPTIVTDELYRLLGLPAARAVLEQVDVLLLAHFAGARCMARVDALHKLGFAMVCASALEDLAEVKSACAGKMALAGNLNGITMRNWDDATAESEVRQALDKAASGGGFLLTDNHGEIPLQVPLDVLDAIAAALHRYGHYPMAEREPRDSD